MTEVLLALGLAVGTILWFDLRLFAGSKDDCRNAVASGYLELDPVLSVS